MVGFKTGLKIPFLHNFLYQAATEFQANFVHLSLLSKRFPATLANLYKMDLVIKEGYAKITTNMKFLNAIENKFLLTTKLTVEGPLRMKEEYTEGMLETPTVDEGTIPQQLREAFGQAVNTVQQLPAPIKDVVSSRLKIPLNGAFQRMFMISYLDEEILNQALHCIKHLKPTAH